ncbi:MAG: DUF493 domain-containing protein [Oligoflexia bacterium]|nr:DUF493 domain-containing protein [Oligoflexia bacterium]
MNQETNFIEVLNSHYNWPCLYPYKFIVPSNLGKNLEALFDKAERVEIKPSKEGKYFSYTILYPVASGTEVLEGYARAKEIKGLVAL